MPEYLPIARTPRTPSTSGRALMALRAFGVVASLSLPLTGCASDIEVEEDEATFTTSPISRNDVMTRARSWIDEKVPYSQSRNHTNRFGTYRTDCSGYVSMAWGLRTSLTTWTLEGVSTPISARDLKPGDALLKNSGGTNHVALFVRWAGNGRPLVWEEYTSGRPAEERTWESLRGYTPVRYHHAQGEADGDGTSCPGGKGTTVGEIEKKYVALGGCKSILGAPMTNEQQTPDKVGRFSVFEQGSIYWTEKTGAHEVHGKIRDRWAALGWEAKGMGYPTTDELKTPDQRGRYNIFEGGSIYWTEKTGAHAVRGAVRDEWAKRGWEAGELGYPTSSEITTVGGVMVRFEHGTIESGADGVNVTMTDDEAAAVDVDEK